jgi:hypothetical protein
MIAKKIIRYYSDCGRGFWKKNQALTHDKNCKCWKNPKFKTCISCKYKNIVVDSNGMEHEPQLLHTFDTNMCKFADSGIPVHEDFSHIRKYCQSYEKK